MFRSTPGSGKHVTPNELRQLRERLRLYHGVDIAILGDAEEISENEIYAELESIRAVNDSARRATYRRVIPFVALAATALLAAFVYSRGTHPPQNVAYADVPAQAQMTTQPPAAPLQADVYVQSGNGTVVRATPGSARRTPSRRAQASAANPVAVVTTATPGQIEQAAGSASNAVTSVPAQQPAYNNRAATAPAATPRITYDISIPYPQDTVTQPNSGADARAYGAAIPPDAAAAALNQGAPAQDQQGQAENPADTTGQNTLPATSSTPPAVTVVVPIAGSPVASGMGTTRFHRASGLGTPVPHGPLPFHNRISRP